MDKETAMRMKQFIELAERFVKAQEDIAQCLSDIGLRTLHPTGGKEPGALEKVAMELERIGDMLDNLQDLNVTLERNDQA